MSDPFILTIRGQTFRIHPPDQERGHSILLCLHGYTGDEFSTEILTRNLHQNHWVINPRGFYAGEKNGYSWVDPLAREQRSAQEYHRSVSKLALNFELLSTDLGITLLPIHLLGFSQGAALASAYSLQLSRPGAKIALLAGFLPEGMQVTAGSLIDRYFFVSHGRNDTTIPLQASHNLVQYLKECGGSVDYCESNTGHKLGMECLKRLESFLLTPSDRSTGPESEKIIPRKGQSPPGQ